MEPAKKFHKDVLAFKKWAHKKYPHIGSSKLSHYLDMALRSSLKYLKENADTIRAEPEGDNR